MGINAERLKTIMRVNNIYPNQIYAGCGYKEDSKLLSDPDDMQITALKKFFDAKYPLVNFSYVLDMSNSPNKLLSITNLQYVMKNKGIGVTQLNTYIKNVLGIEGAMTKILNGKLPENEKQANVIIDYINNKVDNNNDYNYDAVKTTSTKKSTSKKETPKKEETKKQETPKKEETKKEDTKPKKNVAYIRDPIHYKKNEINPKFLVQEARAEGYYLQGFTDMVIPGGVSAAVTSIINGSAQSIHVDVLQNIEAALDCDIAYLEGKQIEKKKHKNKHHYFVTTSVEKNFRFTNYFIQNVKPAILKVMAQNAGISYNLLMRIKYGENVYFKGTTIRRMFTEDLCRVLKVKDINNITVSKDNSKLQNTFLRSASKEITLPDKKEKVTPMKKEEVKIPADPLPEKIKEYPKSETKHKHEGIIRSDGSYSSKLKLKETPVKEEPVKEEPKQTTFAEFLDNFADPKPEEKEHNGKNVALNPKAKEIMDRPLYHISNNEADKYDKGKILAKCKCGATRIRLDDKQFQAYIDKYTCPYCATKFIIVGDDTVKEEKQEGNLMETIINDIRKCDINEIELIKDMCELIVKEKELMNKFNNKNA